MLNVKFYLHNFAKKTPWRNVQTKIRLALRSGTRRQSSGDTVVGGVPSTRHETYTSKDFKSFASAISPHRHNQLLFIPSVGRGERQKCGNLFTRSTYIWRHHPDSNWGIRVLQTLALPLGDGAKHLKIYMLKTTFC